MRKISTRVYVGITKKQERVVFRSAKTPTSKSHGERFYGVIGPFRTAAGARVMATYGRNNPHLQLVSDAEQLAKKLGKEARK